MGYKGVAIKCGGFLTKISELKSNRTKNLLRACHDFCNQFKPLTLSTWWYAELVNAVSCSPVRKPQGDDQPVVGNFLAHFHFLF